MASQIVAERLDLARRVLTIDVKDDLGVISTHSLPLTGDKCPHCGAALPSSTPGTPDINAAKAEVCAAKDAETAAVMAKLAAAGITVAVPS